MTPPDDLPTDRADAGFTLVELLVALTLLATIMAYVSGAFLAVKRSNALTERIEDDATGEAVAVHLRRILEGTAPVLGAGDGEQYALAFLGAGDRIRFVAQSDGRLDVGGLVSIEVGLEPDAGGSGGAALREVRQVFRPSGGQAPAGAPHLLLEGVGALAFRYFGSNAPTEPPGWQEAWTRPDALPLVVEVSFETEDEGSLKPQSFSVALPAAR